MLDPGVRYSFEVRARTAEGWRLYTDTISEMTMSPSDFPLPILAPEVANKRTRYSGTLADAHASPRRAGSQPRQLQCSSSVAADAALLSFEHASRSPVAPRWCERMANDAFARFRWSH